MSIQREEGGVPKLEVELAAQIAESGAGWRRTRERFSFPELPSAGIWRELMEAVLVEVGDDPGIRGRSSPGRTRPRRGAWRRLGERLLLAILQPVLRLLLARELRLERRGEALGGVLAALELRSAHPDHVLDPDRGGPRPARRPRASRPQPRVDQLLPTFSEGDAIGRHVRHIQALLRERGFVSEIFAETWRRPLAARPLGSHRALIRPGDVTIFHFSIGSWTALELGRLPSYRVTNYHNITPARYFRSREDYMTNHLVDLGRRQVPMVRAATDFWWMDSRYNAQDIGVECESVVSPVLRDYLALTRHPSDPKLSRELASDRKDILFVGRLSPNKCQHDLLMLLALYKRHIDRNVRLVLAGGSGVTGYIGELTAAIRELGLTTNGPDDKGGSWDVDVLFSGLVDEAQLASFYRHARLFLCLSEHEGFCVPLVEAMSFGIPVIAHRAGAVPETCGDAALLIDKADPAAALAAMRDVLGNGNLAERLRQSALARAREFGWERLVARFDAALDGTLRRAADARGERPAEAGGAS